MNLKPIQWTPQSDPPRTRRQRASDGDYGRVNGSLLFFIYPTSDPYCKGWRCWDKTRDTKPPEGAQFRYRTHWNVYFYFGSGEGKRVSRALKSRASAKRVARRVLADKIRGMFCASNVFFQWT